MRYWPAQQATAALHWDHMGFSMPPEAQHSGYTTRASIFLRLQSDDAQLRELSWQQFHDRYAPVIAGFARNAGLRGDAIQDVIQDVLTGFFQAAPKFQYDPGKGRFRGYLKKATITTIKKAVSSRMLPGRFCLLRRSFIGAIP